MLENLPIPQDEETKSEDFSNENALQTVSSNYENKNENPKPKRKYTGLIILSVLCLLAVFFGFSQIKAASKIDDTDVFHAKPKFFSKGKYIATISIEGTIEEKIYKLQKKKKELSDSVIESKEVFINSLSKEELEELFSFDL